MKWSYYFYFLHKINKYNDPKSRPNKIKYMCSSNLSKSKTIKTKRVIMLELGKNINLKKKNDLPPLGLREINKKE